MLNSSNMKLCIFSTKLNSKSYQPLTFMNFELFKAKSRCLHDLSLNKFLYNDANETELMTSRACLWITTPDSDAWRHTIIDLWMKAEPMKVKNIYHRHWANLKKTQRSILDSEGGNVLHWSWKPKNKSRENLLKYAWEFASLSCFHHDLAWWLRIEQTENLPATLTHIFHRCVFFGPRRVRERRKKARKESFEKKY